MMTELLALFPTFPPELMTLAIPFIALAAGSAFVSFTN